MIMRVGVLLTALFTLSYGYANDSVGSTAAGGITFLKTPGIKIESEVLKISPTLINVHYQFKNVTKSDITANVFFPLPPYKMEGANAAWDKEVNPHASLYDASFLNFTAYANGKKIKYQTIVRALYHNKDITATLKQAGIPLNPALTAGHLPFASEGQLKKWREASKKLGLLNVNGEPRWQKQILFSWSQVFPAGQITKISHAYRPATGAFFSYHSGENKPTSIYLQNDLKHIENLFGVNPNDLVQNKQFIVWLNNRINLAVSPSKENCAEYTPGQQGCLYAFFFNVDYILKTGANWGGPIKQFDLSITNPANGVVAYNQFYNQNAAVVQQQGETLKIHIKDFVPQKNLEVVYATSANFFNNEKNAHA